MSKPANATEALRECPREPTEEMLFAANHGHTPDETHRRMWTSVWQVMFDNAPVLAEPPKEVAALIERLQNRTLQIHGGTADPFKFHWNLTNADSELHRDAADALARLAAPVPRQDFNEVVQQARENVRPLIEAEAKRSPIETGVIYDDDGKSADRGQQSVRSESDGAGNVATRDDRRWGSIDRHRLRHPLDASPSSTSGG